MSNDSSRYLITLILFLRMMKLVNLLPPSMKDLQFSRFLKNGKNYGIDQYVKNCTFNPTVGISVIYRGEHVNILVCGSSAQNG